jgi:hypothetical protein
MHYSLHAKIDTNRRQLDTPLSISYTFTDFYGVNMREYAEVAEFNDFSLKFNADGMLEYDAKAMGWASAVAHYNSTTFVLQ